MEIGKIVECFSLRYFCIRWHSENFVHPLKIVLINWSKDKILNGFFLSTSLLSASLACAIVRKHSTECPSFPFYFTFNACTEKDFSLSVLSQSRLQMWKIDILARLHIRFKLSRWLPCQHIVHSSVGHRVRIEFSPLLTSLRGALTCWPHTHTHSAVKSQTSSSLAPCPA